LYMCIVYMQMTGSLNCSIRLHFCDDLLVPSSVTDHLRHCTVVREAEQTLPRALPEEAGKNP